MTIALFIILQKGLKIVYSLHMMNGEEGELLHHENSADQFCKLKLGDVNSVNYFPILVPLER